MPYVQRNENGDIVAIWKERPDCEHEFVPASAPEISAFLAAIGHVTPESEMFSASADLQMVRVIEDLVNLLVSKRLITLTELPVAVQHKLLEKRAMREHLLGNVSIIDDGEKSLF